MLDVLVIPGLLWRFRGGWLGSVCLGPFSDEVALVWLLLVEVEAVPEFLWRAS